jgi:hypothetical protein
MSGLACVMLIYFFQETTNSAVGMIVGICAGLITCAFIQMSNIRLMGAVSDEKRQQRINRWLLPTVIGGIVLYQIVTNFLNQEIQYFVSSFVFGWIVIFFTYAAFWAWRNT